MERCCGGEVGEGRSAGDAEAWVEWDRGIGWLGARCARCGMGCVAGLGVGLRRKSCAAEVEASCVLLPPYGWRACWREDSKDRTVT